ncbi:N,N-dimethylformamidase beta subunit family domain-containing protein [Actinomycetospora chiangmaiensis]|uniref:N,N-dimethylformamidase beta subunit family domain-containing protein n=1 Tax=Actinomycetospora chiangmaiensis TaxID=402650 RepID=UPI00036D22D3|nr:N,N-dimethylformamidase beta subunit family domain-containing protein [Actinomycetospora chiangmaiensis]
MGRPLRNVLAVVVLGVLLAGCATTEPSVPPPSPVPSTASPSPSPVPAPDDGPGSPGTAGWQVSHPGPEHAIEGFADHTSVLPGAPVRLFVSTVSPTFTVTAFRMGAYAGSEARQVWTSAPQPGTRQAPPAVAPGTHTVTAPWRPSLDVPTAGWRPGDYLLRLDGGGAQQFVPLTVRSPTNEGRIVVVNAVTTWQAYNRWGGYSLYQDPAGHGAGRARAVSFDRPYQADVMQGAGDFLFFELPFVLFAERTGVPLGYATDVDLDEDPHLLDGARAVITLGHDEYWSPGMRDAVTAARDRGVNLAFLGGNEMYRHMRFGDTPVGPHRLEIDYKSFVEDPVHLTDPAAATPQWREGPVPRPESTVLGNFYQCNPVQADLVVADPENWLLAGIVAPGEHYVDLVGNEYERVDLTVPTPRPLEVLFHSPVSCRGRPDTADTTYYTAVGGAGVFSAGTQYWICGLDPGCTRAARSPRTLPVISAITRRLLLAYAQGPVGLVHPAQDNLAALHIDARGAVPH